VRETSVHAGDKALTRETLTQRGRGNRYAYRIFDLMCRFAIIYQYIYLLRPSYTLVRDSSAVRQLVFRLAGVLVKQFKHKHGPSHIPGTGSGVQTYKTCRYQQKT
jgi:hypothetical protein